jgi:hypothetical protein
VIGLLLVVHVPDASDVSHMAILLRRLDRFMLCLETCEDTLTKLWSLMALPTVGDTTINPTCNAAMAHGKTRGPAKDDAIAPSVHSV